jgi:CubicO group peptidase (beta-lactamase class C family)
MIKKSILLLSIAFATSSFGESVARSQLQPLFGQGASESRAAMLIVDGRTVEKQYAPGYSDKNRFISWSMAKSVTAVLVGEMVADGTLKLDAPVPFVEWHKPGDPHAGITLRNMLNMSSGLDHTEGLNPEQGAQGVLNSDTTMSLFVSGTGNMVARNIAKGLEAKPGTKYEYSSMTSLLLSELITRQLTESKDPKVRAAAYTAFATERLFKPAGITSAVLEFDGAGTQIGGSIIHMTLGDWGRFGQVLLAGKGTDGSQAIAPDWLAFMRTPSTTNAEYGGHVWLNRIKSRETAKAPALFPGKGPDSLFAAVGHLGQFVIVSPDQKMVLVRLGKTNDGDLQPVRDALGDIAARVPIRMKGNIQNAKF